jgi:multiple antibiotic resistance protein
MTAELLKEMGLAFIPVFVAVDPIGVLPIFVALTRDLDARTKKKIIAQSLLTALCLAVGFIVLGKATFKFLGIAVGDFMVAGGAILFCIALTDLLVPGKRRRMPGEDAGAVPIGTPLIAGPAVLTTSLIVVDQHGLAVALTSVLANIALVGLVFYASDHIIKIVGKSGTRALSKVMALFLAAIAVMMIRKGILSFLTL